MKIDAVVMTKNKTMSNLQNDRYYEDLQDAKEEYEDCIKGVAQAEEDLREAERWLARCRQHRDETQKVYLALMKKEF